ncbi:hypothetical protein DPMN_004100 [Dreissena polymorpha]|uniref:Uncharacterized protein n=1 Tax=Dreissena polymorpha TaxID=45954 RepID=A0A9D4MMV4_DREPO|nr:hypothetical protein DPMN_004100 [Dreissena polymorpha]
MLEQPRLRIKKLDRYIDHDWQMTPIDFQVTRSKVKVTGHREYKLKSRGRERDNAMTRMRQYDDDSATIRWRESDGENAICDSTMATMRECKSMMTRIRQCDDKSATIRWRERDGENARTREYDDENARVR